MKTLKEEGFYVLVRHTQTDRYWLLNRQYAIVDESVRQIAGYPKIDLHLLANEGYDGLWASTWVGWVPTMDSQLPTWAKGLPASEFKAYWTKD